MDRFRIHTRHTVALLFLGSAILLMSCKGEKEENAEGNTQELMTQQSENLTVIDSKAGKTSFRFETPLMERYSLAKQPYTEFRKGVKIETFNDTTGRVESTLTANYAITMEKQDLWEAKGNVVATNDKGQKLETQQLFWDRPAKRIYSNVDTKVTMPNGDETFGEGFESNEQLDNIVFRKATGRATFEMEADSSASAPKGNTGTTTLKPANTKLSEKEEADLPLIKEGEAVAKPKQ